MDYICVYVMFLLSYRTRACDCIVSMWACVLFFVYGRDLNKLVELYTHTQFKFKLMCSVCVCV